MKNIDETQLSTIWYRHLTVLATLLAVLVWTSVAPGQRGMGSSRGIAQLGWKPHVVRISGKVLEIKTHPCEQTTGKAELGTHVILEDKQGRELNIHLGPAPVVAEAVEQLTVGRRLDVLGFRTDQMPPNQYVAKTLILGNRRIQLRDSELRPYWSSSRSGNDVRPIYGLACGRQGATDTANQFGRCSQGLRGGRRGGALRVNPTRRCCGRSGWCERYGRNGRRWAHANAGSNLRGTKGASRFAPRNFDGRR